MRAVRTHIYRQISFWFRLNFGAKDSFINNNKESGKSEFRFSVWHKNKIKRQERKVRINQKISAKGFSVINREYIFRNYDLYAMLLPGLILMIVFRFVPLYGMLIAFKDYDMSQSIMKSPWVGLKWFKVLFENPDFGMVLRNTLVINMLDIIFVFFGAILFAILIHEMNCPKYKRVVQTLSYLPHFLSWVVVGGLLIQILSPSNMFMQTVSKLTGRPASNLLLNKNNFWGIVTVGEMWKSWGWSTILYLAAMSGISPELYEAARIDGAGKIRQMLNITLPGIKFIIVTTLLMKIGGMLNIGFEKIFVLQNNMIVETSEVFSTWNYKMGIVNWNSSLSTALSFFEAIVNFALVFIFDRFAKMIGEEGLF